MKFSGAVSFVFSLVGLSARSVSADGHCNRTCVGNPCANMTGKIGGFVFEDRNRDGIRQMNETGICGVMVSNGLEVVQSQCNGCYMLPLPTREEERAGIFYFVTEPDGYDVPMVNMVPKGYYLHKPLGSPLNVRNQTFRYGGIPPTGPLPASINFPLIKTMPKPHFKIVTSGDTQTYSIAELTFYRETSVKEWIEMGDELDGIILVGDNMGDDMSIYRRLQAYTGLAGVPQYHAAGNHDLDFDAPSDDHSFDTFRFVNGPEYFSFEIGQVHFVVMDDVRYPCDRTDNADGLHSFCIGQSATYNGVITNRQMQWLKNDLAHVPKDKIIFLIMHIPVVSYIDQNAAQHSVDNAVDLWKTVGCVRSPDGIFRPQDCERQVIAVFGHTHTLENMYPGEDFEGWRKTLDASTIVPAGRAPGPVPFHHIVAGATSGTWWTGDFTINGNPIMMDRVGSPNGYVIWEFNRTKYVETFKGLEQPKEKSMSIDFSTPDFRRWFAALRAWVNLNPNNTAIPPENRNTLPDTRQVLRSELNQTFVQANVWIGTKVSKVSLHIDGYGCLAMTRTQPGRGENFIETLDVYALKQQMMLARHAFVNSKDVRANGFELFRGTNQCPTGGVGPCTPRPMGSWTWTDQSQSIWQVALPNDLKLGIYKATIEHIDWHGIHYHEHISFEVLDQRPNPFFDRQKFAVLP